MMGFQRKAASRAHTEKIGMFEASAPQHHSRKFILKVAE